MSKVERTPTCYLCGKPITGPKSKDHVPPQQFYADSIRRSHALNLMTLPTHLACNHGFHLDEEYFVNTLAPFAVGSTAGNALLDEIFSKTRAGKNARLTAKVLREFEQRPSGIVLPPGLIAKRFEGHRLTRVAWKIARGLYFHHYGAVVPEGRPHQLRLIEPGRPPPVEFLRHIISLPTHGRYPGVFDYRMGRFPEVHNFNYVPMLLWDKLLLIVTFHDASCDCEACVPPLVPDDA